MDRYMRARLQSRVLLVALMMHAVVELLLLVFVSHAFGFTAAIEISLVLTVPLVAAWLSYRSTGTWGTRDNRLLVLLYALALGVIVGVIAHWFSTGLDRRHSEFREYERFKDRIREDPRFDDVVVQYAKRGIILIGGRVPTEADRKRLIALAREYKMPWLERRLVVGGN